MSLARAVSKSRSGVHGRVKAALIGSVLPISILFANPQSSQAQVVPADPQCVVSGTTVTCTGDLSTGVDVDGPPYDALNILNVDPPGIMPASGIAGVDFTATVAQDITVNVDTSGTAGVSTTGADAEGIFAYQVGGDGDITITSTGNVTTTGTDAEGIFARQDGGDGDISVVSTGNISTAANDANGIDAEQSDGIGNVSVVSVGNINTTGDESNGIYAVQYGGNGNVNVSSTGNITTQGDESHGIFTYQDDGDGDITITSTGNISTQGTEFSTGIYAQMDFGAGIISISSSGNITTTAERSDGIFVQSTSGVGALNVNSSGDINTTGVNAEGILVRKENFVGDVNVTTSGNINSANSVGIYAGGFNGNVTINALGDVSGTTGILITRFNSPFATDATINTFGAVTGTGGVAILFEGDGNDTLNLGPGTVFTGTIDFGNGNDNMGGTNPDDIDTLNALPGFNGELTFADSTLPVDSDLESAPEIVSSNIALINGGLTAVAVDPSGFAASSAFLGTFTNTIFNSLDTNGSAPQEVISTHGGDGPYAYGSGPRYWMSGFGGQQEVDAGSANVDISHRFGGGMIGAEGGFGDGTAGIFGGYGHSNMDLQFSAGELDVETYFGGAYWKKDYGSHRIHLAFVGGSADHDATRNISGAIPTIANGDYGGWFVSPSVTLAAPVNLLNVPVVASVRASYSGMWLDGYTETGSVANPLTVSDREVHLFNARAQITLPHYIANADGSHSHFEFRLGVDAQFDAGSSNVNANVGGTAISFNADLDDDVAGFVGASFTRNSVNGMLALTASGEVQSGLEGGYEFTGEIKASVKF